MLSHGSTFSGIGGIDLGFERAGIKTIWQVEKSKYCRYVLRKNFAGVKQFSDIRKVGKHNLASVHVISGGFPCQPFSLAGKQRGETDNRFLWPEMFRVIDELRPPWVLAENVPGIIKLAIDRVLADLEGIGYTCSPIAIPACALGAPHIRMRIWIIAHSESVRRIAQFRHESNGVLSEILANPNGGGFAVQRQSSGGGGFPACRREDVADSECTERWPVTEGRNVGNGHDARREETPSGIGTGGEDVGNAGGARCAQRKGPAAEWPHAATGGATWWAVEPDVGRVAHGIPARVDRLKALGNAVVPQIAEAFGKMIVNLS